jgi:hypothetical protein
MTDRAPSDTKNLDRYGFDALPWDRPGDLLRAGVEGPDTMWFLGTVGPDGRPHAAGIGAVWFEGDLYFTSGAGAQKARHLAANPACTISTRLKGIDLVFEGSASRVTDDRTLQAVVKIYNRAGWPAEVEGDAYVAPFNAPSAGPPPWSLYRMTYDTVFGVATAEPYGATRWRFG